jgi:hypothetical protein
MRQIIVVLGLVLAGLVLLPRLAGQTEGPDKKKVTSLMQRKLVEAQKVLEAISLADFDKIITHADALNDISKQAEWRAYKTPTYEMFSGEFQRTAVALARSDKDKNIDAAALAYVDLTLTCVKCHKHVREIRQVRAD